MALRSRPLRTRVGVVAATVGAATLTLAPWVHAELPPLIPREVFFPPPAAMQDLQLSPDGRQLSYLAPDGEGARQLWLRDLGGAAARQLTAVESPGVGFHGWAENGRLLFYERRQAVATRLVGIDLPSGTERTLIGMDGTQIGTPVTRPSAPDELLVALRSREVKEDDVYRLNVVTGDLVLDTKNPGGVRGDRFFADGALRVRAVLRTTGGGGTEILVRDGPADPWRPWMSADSSYSLAIEAFTGDGGSLLLRTDLGADKSRLVVRSLADGRERVLAGSDELDLERVLLHPQTGAVQAVSFLEDPRRWQALDPKLAADLHAIRRIRPGALNIGSRDRGDRRWLVWLGSDRAAPRCYLWDRETRRSTLLLDQQPELASLPLARVRPISLAARDGVRLRGYLTLPRGVQARRLPLVVWVHGGPYLRDSWGYDRIGQFFANRGYAFLRVNFRGSQGFGRSFRLASFKQWGRAMQDDVVDAVEWAVRSGFADRSRMAIMGHSYGGYVALAGLTLTPDLFACGAASSTAADLLAFVGNFPKTPGNAWVRTTVGDPENPEEAERLRSVSPVFHVDRLRKPLLLARGDKDGILPPGELDAFVGELQKRGRPVVSVVYEGDGHFFKRENELDYFARVEALLALHLGGRAEAMVGERQPGSTARVTRVGM